jgi:glucosamine-6-phosphate deaminase
MQVVHCGDEEGWVSTVAARFVEYLAAHPQAKLCLATGLTPLPVYARIADSVSAGLASFTEAEVFLLDEFGGVAPDAEGRCDAMLRRGLLNHVDLLAARYHRPVPEAPDLETMCRAFDATIAGSLDLALLGLGTNGHIGMNEPGSSPDSRTRRVDLDPETIKASARYFGSGPLPTWGVTIGLGPLLASRTVWLLATGERKAEIVRAIVEEPPTTDRPASLLRAHPDCWLFVDAAAASRLTRA